MYLTANCGPSQQMSKAIKKAVKSKEIEAEFVIIESDPARVKKEGILAIPTTQIFNNNGQVIKTLVGYNVNIIKYISEAVNE